MSKKRQTIELRDYLHDILRMISDIKEFTKDLTFSHFKTDKKTVYAVIRCMEVIGEAVKQIPAKNKRAYTEIPWDEISGMRNKLIHEYFGADIKIIWDTIQEDLPPLENTIMLMIRNLFLHD